MTANIWLGAYVRQDLPPPEEVSHFFLDFGIDKWPTGGRIAVYGAKGTESLPPYGGRVDISLAITPHVQFGFYFVYAKLGDSSLEQYHSVGDASLLRPGSPMVEIDDNEYAVAAGLFVPPTDAWRVVKHFIETEGERSDAIAWLKDEELPPSSISTPV